MALAFDAHFERQTTGGVDLFIKRGNSNLQVEARNQAFELAQSDLDAPSVPKVYHTFDDNRGSTYLVMAHIPTPALTFRAWVGETGLEAEERVLRLEAATEKIATAISWLLACPIPEDRKIGPVGGGPISTTSSTRKRLPSTFSPRSLWKVGYQGWYQFNHSTVDSNTLMQALSRLPASTRPKVPLSHELLLSPSDITLDNFLYDPSTGRVWMIDYQHVNVLPVSLVSFALHGSQDPFMQAVANKVDLAPSPHLGYLRRAAGYISQCGNSSLGLDGHGNPERSAIATSSGYLRPIRA